MLFILFLGLWCALIGIKGEDLVVGIGAALCSTFAASRLLPGSAGRSAPIRALVFAATFLRQSLLAGVDVARRAFSPSLPLSTGFVRFAPRQRPGLRRDLFVTLSSMMPGTLPVGGDDGGGIVVHALDTSSPVAEEMAADEARFAEIFREGRHG